MQVLGHVVMQGVMLPEDLQLVLLVPQESTLPLDHRVVQVVV